MANNNFSKTTLDLTSPICMDINDNVVRPFDSFNKKNAAFFGDQLSPLYVTKEKAVEGEVSPVYDNQGNRWSLITKMDPYEKKEFTKLYKNGVEIKGSPKLENTFSKTEIINREYLYSGLSSKGTRVELWRQKDIVYDGTILNEYYYSYGDKEYRINNTLPRSFGNIISRVSQGEEKDDNFYFLCVIYEPGVQAYRFKLIELTPSGWNRQTDLIEVLDSDSLEIFHRDSFVTSVEFADKVCFSIVPNKCSRENEVVFARSFAFVNKLSEAGPLQFDVKPVYLKGTYKKSSWGNVPLMFMKKNGRTCFFNCGKYNEFNNETDAKIRFFGDAKITELSLVSDHYEVSSSSYQYFEVNGITRNLQPFQIGEKVAVSYSLYPNYYEQTVCIQKGDIFIPARFTLNEDTVMAGGNISTATINESTLAYSDIPQCIYYDDFYLNVNNGFPSSVMSENENLILPWNDMDGTPVTFENGFYYKDVNGKFFKVVKDVPPTIDVIYNNRYILIKSDSFDNVYDIEKDLWYKWSVGYNGNLKLENGLMGIQGQPKVPNADTLDEFGRKYNNITLVAGGHNVNYEITKNPFPSSIFPASRLLGVYQRSNSNWAPQRYNLDTEIDVYVAKGSESLVPIYQYTYKSLLKQRKIELANIPYPENPNILYSLSLDARFIKSFNNHDFVIQNNISYPLIYSNNYPIFAYNALSFIENINNVFVIQGSNYLLFDNKIMATQYQGTQILGSTIVADVTGMTFIGNTNQVAFFFSKLAKKIYVFTGDVVLREQRGANVIDEIYSTSFIPADNSVLMSCREHDGKDYLYFFGSDSLLRLQVPEVHNYFFGDDKVIVTDINGDALKLSYYKRDNMEKLPIELQTGYFGIGNEMSSVIDCWYIRLFDEDRESGDVTIQQNTLTNIGAKTESKTIHINRGDWDEQTNSYLIRYQPRYQNGVGIQLNLKSDFAIYEIVVSSRQGETQLTAPKAQI